MSSTTTPSRDPSDYRLSIHAAQRRREREIPYELIGETIRRGETRDTHDPTTRLFVADIGEHDAPLAVAANVQTGEIVTVAWRNRDE